MAPCLLSRVSVSSLIISAGAALLFIAAADARAQTAPRAAARGQTTGVAQISERWAKEWGAKNLAAVIALYADDAVFLPSTGSRVTGRAAIRDLFEKALATNTSNLHVRSKVTEQSGDLAYERGEYEETMTSAGVTRSGQGNYLVILRRNGNQWLIVEHMWTDIPAAPR
jgi:uncharacterized protein (TIGR02246 family)